MSSVVPAGMRVAVAAVPLLAIVVAFAIKRPPPRFAAPPIAVVRDAAGAALWTVRLAPQAHEIAADRLTAAPAPRGRAYQLWLATSGGPRSLGLLPVRGRRVIPEIPARVERLAGGGKLLVSLEPAGGSPRTRPSGPIVFLALYPPR